MCIRDRFYWFPHTDACLVKRNRRLGPDEPAGEPQSPWAQWWTDSFVDNTVFEGINRALTHCPRATPWVNRISAKAMSRRAYTAVTHRVFVSPRSVRFRESEYAVERAAAPEILRYLAGWFERTREPVSFPVEVRYAAADDVWPVSYTHLDVYKRHGEGLSVRGNRWGNLSLIHI